MINKYTARCNSPISLASDVSLCAAESYINGDHTAPRVLDFAFTFINHLVTTIYRLCGQVVKIDYKTSKNWQYLNVLIFNSRLQRLHLNFFPSAFTVFYFAVSFESVLGVIFTLNDTLIILV